MKKLLSLLITLSVLGLGFTLSASLYWMAESEFQKHINKQAENVHYQVQQRFRVFDELLSSDEKQVQEHARRALVRLSDVFLHENFDPKSSLKSAQLARGSARHRKKTLREHP